MFYVSVRQTNGEPFKVSSLKAIRAAIDRYLKQAPINKPWSIVRDNEFKKANDTLNAVCKNLMKGGKVGPVVHKTPIRSEQLKVVNWEMRIQKMLNNYSKPRGFTHTCISGGEEEKTNAVSLQRCLSSAKHPRVDDILSYEESFRERFCRQKTINAAYNTDEADAKMFEVRGSPRCPVKTL